MTEIVFLWDFNRNGLLRREHTLIGAANLRLAMKYAMYAMCMGKKIGIASAVFGYGYASSESLRRMRKEGCGELEVVVDFENGEYEYQTYSLEQLEEEVKVQEQKDKLEKEVRVRERKGQMEKEVRVQEQKEQLEKEMRNQERKEQLEKKVRIQALVARTQVSDREYVSSGEWEYVGDEWQYVSGEWRVKLRYFPEYEDSEDKRLWIVTKLGLVIRYWFTILEEAIEYADSLAGEEVG